MNGLADLEKYSVMPETTATSLFMIFTDVLDNRENQSSGTRDIHLIRSK